MWTKRINKKGRKIIIRTQTTNALAKKEANLEAKEAEVAVEAVSVVKTTDTKKDNQQRLMGTSLVQFINTQTINGSTARRIQKVQTSREVINNKYRTEEEVNSLLQEAGLAVAVDMAAV